MVDPAGACVDFETEPSAANVRDLEERLYAFNVQATGVADGKLFAHFLRDEAGAVAGGVYGWTWGDTCFVRLLMIPAPLRSRGHGRRLMQAVEAEATTRGCTQIVLETHDFQAPGFYRRLGFEISGRVENYPRGHQYLTMVKRLAGA